MFTKKYKKGMADAAKAYVAFGKKQEEAINFILNEVREERCTLEEAIRRFDGSLDSLYKYLNDQERAKLYTICTPNDIIDLDENDKFLLVSLLFILTKDKVPTENQQKYFTAVQMYLSVKEPSATMDVLSVEDIDSLSTQKAFYQVVLEYLILQDGENYDETELQQKLLDAFYLKDNHRSLIEHHVRCLYNAAGANGLAIKYGFAEEEAARRKENEELHKIHEKEKAKELKIKTINTILKLLDFHSFYKKCIETKNYILFSKENFKTIKYIVVNKKTGEQQELNESTSLSRWPGKWFAYGDSVVTTIEDSEYRKVFKLDLDTLKVTDLGINIHQKWQIEKLIGFISNYVFKTTINSVTNKRSIEAINILDNSSEIIINDCNPEVTIVEYKDGILLAFNYEIYYYSLTNKKIQKLTPNNEWHNIKCVGVNDDKIYIFELIYDDDSCYGFQKYRISSVTSTNNNFSVKVIVDGYTYTREYFGLDPTSFEYGFYFIGEESKKAYEYDPVYDLMYFSFETEKLTKVANGCGETEWKEKGIFNKTREISTRKINDIDSFGSYLVYRKDFGNFYKTTFLYVDVKEPMQINSYEGEKHWTE